MGTPREMTRQVAARLHSLQIPFAFVGGAVLELLVDDPRVSRIRVTKDVDVVVSIATYAEQVRLEERLRQADWQHDTSGGAPICRWLVDGLLVDIMPKNSDALGLSSRWFDEVLREAQPMDFGVGVTARVVTPALFLATKIEAFRDRGRRDFLGSRDLEDIVTVINGRARIVDDVSNGPAVVRAYLRESFAGLLESPYFQEALPEHIYYLEGSRDRSRLVLQRFEAIAHLPG